MIRWSIFYITLNVSQVSSSDDNVIKGISYRSVTLLLLWFYGRLLPNLFDHLEMITLRSGGGQNWAFGHIHSRVELLVWTPTLSPKPSFDPLLPCSWHLWLFYSACVQFAHAAYELTLLTTLIKKSEVVKIDLKYIFFYYVMFILTEKEFALIYLTPSNYRIHCSLMCAQPRKFDFSKMSNSQLWGHIFFQNFVW